MRSSMLWSLLPAVALLAQPASAKDARMLAGLQVERLVSDPAEITFEAGASLPVTITPLDAEGEPVDAELRIVGRGVSYADGAVTAPEGGEGTLIASVVLPPNADMEPATLLVPVPVTWPRVASIDVTATGPETLYTGTTVRFDARASLSIHVAQATVEVTPRAAVREVQGQGSVSYVHSSDLWIHEGPTAVTTRSPAHGAATVGRTSGTSPTRPAS